MEMKNGQYEAGFPGKVYAGEKSLGGVKEFIEQNGAERVVLLVDQAVAKLPAVVQFQEMLGAKLAGVIDGVPAEPTCYEIRSVYDRVVQAKADLLAAIGGGSVMDMTKVVAAAVSNPEYAEAGFMKPELITRQPIRTIMAPTTAGTGAEATPNAIFLVPEQELKVGVVSPAFRASCVVLDPELTVGLPPQLTASTGLDALCHAVESYLSILANPISRVFSLHASKLIAESLETAYQDGSDLHAREQMLLGSFFAGLCLSSSSTVAVHALSYPLGGKYHIPHGIANAILLPWVLQLNLPDCRTQYREIAQVMLPKEQLEAAQDPAETFVEYIFQLCRRLQIPESLRGFGVKPDALDELTENAMQVKRLLLKNPRKLTREEIRSVYERLL